MSSKKPKAESAAAPPSGDVPVDDDMDDLELLAELEAMDHEENNAQQKQQQQPPEEEDAEDDDHKAAATAAPPKPHVETKALSGSVDLAMLKRSCASSSRRRSRAHWSGKHV